MNLPIEKINENEIFYSDDEVSYWFKVEGIDIDWYSRDQLESIVAKMSQELMLVDPGHFYKFYFWDNKIFLQSNNPLPKLSEVKINAKNEPVNDLLGFPEIASDVIFGDDYVLVNGKYFGFISILEFPNSLTLKDLQNLGPYMVTIQKIDRKKSESILEMTRKSNASTYLSKRRDYKGEKSLQEGENLLELLENGQEELFKVEPIFIVFSDTEESFRVRQRELLHRLIECSFKPLIETTALNYVFYQYFLGLPYFERSHELYSSLTLNTLPIVQDKFYKSGFRLESLSGYPVGIDLFDRQNQSYSMMITGNTGSGKTMFAQKVLLEQMKDDTHFFIFDPKGDFNKFAIYFNFEILSNSFNPLQFKDPRFLKEVIISCMDKVNLKLEGELIQTIKKLPLNEINSMAHLLNALDDKFPELKFYFEEILPFFNDEIIHVPQYLLIKFTHIPKRIYGPLFIYLIKLFDQIDSKKILLMDECHRILVTQKGWITEQIREMRAKNGSLITISQRYNDFSKSSIGEIINSQSFFKVFGNQKVVSDEYLDEEDLTEINNALTEKGEYSIFYVKTETMRKPLLYRASPFEYELFTSDPRDKKEMQKYFDERVSYLGFQRTFDKWVDLKYA